MNRVRLQLVSLEARDVPSTVDILTDVVDPNDGKTSLREAIIAANAATKTDTINFNVTGLITLTSSLPIITQSVDIVGPGALSLSVSGANAFKMFNFELGITSSISGLTITGGSGFGGISNNGTLTVSNCNIRGNSSALFAAIDNNGSMTIRDCIVSDNSTNGIDNSGMMTIQGSTISGNSKVGIVNASGIITSSLTIRDSTVSGNSVGGIINTINLTASNCTIVGNTGGPGFIEGKDGGPATLTNTTITGNSGTLSGAGIRLEQNPGVVTLQNTIVAGNIHGSTPDDLFGPLDPASSFNLIGTGGSGGLTDGVNSNQVGVANPGLGALANNGGPTATVRLLAGSPALNSGSNALAAAAGLSTDQRGQHRVSGTTVDIGAFEAQAPFVFTVDSLLDSNVRDNVLTLREAILLDTEGLTENELTPAERAQVGENPDAVADTIMFSVTGTISLATALPNLNHRTTNHRVMIVGPGAANLTVTRTTGSAGIFFVSGGTTASISGLTISDPSAAGAATIFGDGLGPPDSVLTIDRCIVTNNTTGLGIVSLGMLTITNSTVSNNTGGGISAKRLTLTNSTVSGNQPKGGILLTIDSRRDDPGSVLTNDTISGNLNGRSGGGIDVEGEAPVSIINCTIANNTSNTKDARSGGGGGGVYTFVAVVTIINSTIVGNTASLPADPNLVSPNFLGGGGVCNNDGNIALINTIVAGNAASVSPDIDNLIVDSFNSLIGNGSRGNLVDGVNGNKVGGMGHSVIDPQLGALANNGGLTQTMAPQPGSPALNAGSNTAAAGLVTDQRGAGFTRVFNGTVDIGAVEVQPDPIPVVVAPTSLPSGQLGTVYNQTISASGPVGPFTLVVTSGSLPLGLTLSSAGALTGTPTVAGTSSFTVTATGPALAAGSRAYTLTIDPPLPPPPPLNTPPAISDVVNQTTILGTASGPIAFTVSDTETAPAALVVLATSSNTAVVTNAGIIIGGSGANRTVTVNTLSVGTATITLTVTDAGGLTATDTFVVMVNAVSPPPPPPGTASPVLIGFPQFAAGADVGGGSVTLYNPDKSVRFSLTPFAGFTGGVRTTSADFNGDGIADLVVGTGPGRATQVIVLDGVTQKQLFTVDPFEAAFTGGVYVAAGDINGDGFADLVITPDEGGGPRARVFSGKGFVQLADFFGIDDTNFRGGARAAIGDITGDGKADLVVAAGFGGGPRVAVFDGAKLASEGGLADQNAARWNTWKPFGDFLTFEAALRNGAFVAAGDLNGDGFAELIAGGGPGGGPRVTAFSGKDLLSNTQTPLANFFGGDVNNRGGIRVSVKNLDGDNLADVVVGSGTGAGSRVTAYAGKAINVPTPPELFAFDAIAGFSGGVFVG